MELNKEEPIILHRIPFLAYVKFMFCYGLTVGVLAGLFIFLAGFTGELKSTIPLTHIRVSSVVAGIGMAAFSVCYFTFMGTMLSVLTYYMFTKLTRMLGGFKIKPACLSNVQRIDIAVQNPQPYFILHRLPYLAFIKFLCCFGLCAGTIVMVAIFVILLWSLIFSGTSNLRLSIWSFAILPIFPLYLGFLGTVSSIVLYFPFRLITRILGEFEVPVDCFKNLSVVDENEAPDSTELPEPSENPYESPQS